jgi:hypothetical protein
MKHYLYLVKQKNNLSFKVGYTTNPRQRYHQYKTHSLDVEIICYREIPDKKLEKLAEYELLKDNFKKCNSKQFTEWFEGSIDYLYFQSLVNRLILNHNNFINKIY